MADLYSTIISGARKFREAIVTSAGAGDSGKIPALDAAGKLDSTMMPAGVGADSLSVVASETMSADSLVSLWNDGGTLKARYANATAAGDECHGFITDAVTATNSVTVYFDGAISGLSGLTPGARLFLGTTDGQLTETMPTTSGNVVQEVGFATSATTAEYERGQSIEIE